VWRIDLEVDGLAGDALVVAGDSGGLILDLALDVAKVGVAPVGDVVELAPFARARDIRVVLGRVRRVLRDVGILVGDVNELEDQGPACDDTAAAGQKVTANNVLEYGGLSSRLRADDDLQDAG
jgi:hypothetical protein